MVNAMWLAPASADFNIVGKACLQIVVREGTLWLGIEQDVLALQHEEIVRCRYPVPTSGCCPKSQEAKMCQPRPSYGQSCLGRVGEPSPTVKAPVRHHTPCTHG